MDILLYFIIMLVGYFLAKYKIMPNIVIKRIEHLQSIALCIMLTAMGFAIGSDDHILANISTLGLRAFVISLFAIIFSIVAIKLIYRGDR